MKKDSKLSRALHIVLHLAEESGPVTSDRLAVMMKTNPVVVRRIMAGLRDRSYVSSEKGHGGGWRLNCDLKSLTLRDIYDAVGCPDCIALSSRNTSPTCLVEQAVNSALCQAFEEVEALLLTRFEGVTLASLSADFHTRFENFKRHRGQITDA